MVRNATHPTDRSANLRRRFTYVQVLLGFGAVGAFAAALLPPAENARRETKQVSARSSSDSPQPAPSSEPSLRARDEIVVPPAETLAQHQNDQAGLRVTVPAMDGSMRPALDPSRSTAAEAPPHIRALHLETIEENATLDIQTGQVAGLNPDDCPGTPVVPGETIIGNNGNALAGTPTLCGGGNDLFDVWHFFESPCTGTAKISLCGPGTTFDTTLAVYDNCLERVRTELACDDDFCLGTAGPSQLEISVVTGTPYFIRIAGFNGARGQYQLNLDLTCCVNCPTGGTFENESNCGLPDDNFNGGCNPGNSGFSPLSCGQTYCGTGAFDGTTRDTDWYQVEVANPTQFTWTVSTEFLTDIGLASTDPPGSGNCANLGPLSPHALVAPCSTGNVSVCLPPGKHWFFVAPNFDNPPVACGARYTARLTCTTCVLDEACCLPDGACRFGPPTACLESGGTLQGPGTSCATVVCPLPTGACCAPPQACTSSGPCGPLPRCGGSFSCFCFDTAEGGLDCSSDFPCSTAAPCPNGTPSCPTGQVCYVGTCCEIPICAPPRCGTATADGGMPIGGTGAEELTASGTPPLTVAGALVGVGGECLQVDSPTCQLLGGLYQGDFTQCGLVSCPAPLGACCADGCFITDRATCESVGGPYLGDGTNCNDPTICAPPPEACCLRNGDCIDTVPDRCREAGGVSQGPNSQCQGDKNGDGIDDACGSRPCEECGPGLHWIDETPCPPGDPLQPGVCKSNGATCLSNSDCPGSCEFCDVTCTSDATCSGGCGRCLGNECNKPGVGQDTVPSGAVLGIDTNGDCVAETNIVVFGAATIGKKGPVDDATNFPNLRPVDGHKDVVDTEILGMSLSGGGITLTAGAGLGNQPLPPTHGAVAEQPGDPSLADSFFDVFVEIDRGAGPNQFLYNQTPIRVQDVISCLPPNGNYIHITGCRPLFTSPTGGESVANLVSANHFTYPACCQTNAGPLGCGEIPAARCEELGGTIVADCLGDGNANGFDDACEPKCEPDATSPTRCTEVCPIDPIDEKCLPSKSECDPANPGSCGVLACECMDPNACRLQFNAAGRPFCEGACPVPPGGDCVLRGDGSFDNPYGCDCVEAPPAPCCIGAGLFQGQCAVLSAELCAATSGKPVPACLGDTDGDGIDEACAAAPCAECGPGLHWIHDPPCPPGGSGQDTLPSGAYAGIDVNNDCIADINFVLGGPVTIRKKGPEDDSANYPGLRPIDGHLDVIDTEILAMSLTGGGVTLTAGAGLSAIPLSPSNGAIAEDPNNANVADSFFDVFFEITDGLGLQAYNRTPIRVATRIDCLPPDGIYAHITGCTPLFSSPSPTGGTFVGNLVSANHFTYPACCFGTFCVKDVPTQACEIEQGTVVPDCLGDNNNNKIDDACECGPTPDGSGCRQSICPTSVEQCRPKCATLDPTTGRMTVNQCECAGPNECRVEITPTATVAGTGECIVPDNGSGTATLPPAGCAYLSPNDVHRIIDGLPPGTTIELGAAHEQFFNQTSGPGGALGGEHEFFQSTLQLNLNGTGDLAGFNRNLIVPSISCETHTGPRNPGDPVQSFDTDMFTLQGQLPPGDPDFDLLRITGGTGFGLPSPGHTTLTQMPGGNWVVDSFFDITYRIDFVGAPGSALAGRSGSTTGTIRMQTPTAMKCVGGCVEGEVCNGRRTVNPDGTFMLCCGCAPPTTVEIDHFPNTVAAMELQMEGGGSELIHLSGPTTVHVFFEGANEGDANDSDGDGLDDVQTEMVDMQLTGNSSFGPVVVRLHPTKPSRGQIEEQANTQAGRLDLPPFAPSGTASSFFDVFFEIRVGPFVLHTQTPKRMSSVIDHKPPGPGTTYESPLKIPLLDEQGNATQFSIGAGRHIPRPVVEIDHFPNTVAAMELQMEGGGSELIHLSGPTTVHVFFEGANEGEANDSDGDGLDDVQTEMVDMQLTGNSSFGPVVVRLHPSKPSRGQIEEQANTQAGRLDLPPFAPAGTASSFFDVFFEIRVGPFVLHTQTPKRMSSVIDHKPPGPGTTYESPLKIPLLDEQGNATQFSIGAGRHIPRPVVEIDHFPNTVAAMELQMEGGGSELIHLSGPTTVHVFFEGANEGEANDSDGDGLDDVQTEMVDMQLTGNSSFGPVVVRLHPTKPSRGQIEEQANTQAGRLDLPPFAPSGTASSFFDVFFEIRVGPFVLHTQTPKRMSSVIDHKPPGSGTTYESPLKIPLLDEQGNATQFSIGAGRHIPRPVVEIDHFPNTVAAMELQMEGGGSELIHLSGPTTVHVFFEGANEGEANDSDGDGLDDVQTEMVDMQLTGNSSFGPVVVRLHPSKPSRGQIEEQANTQAGRLDLPPFAPAGTASSFFDVFFEIRVGPFVLHTQTPKRMSSVIDHKPPGPGTTYESPLKIPLLDEQGNATQFSIGAGRHIPRPTCGSDGTGDCFISHDTPFCNQGECCERVCALAQNCCATGWNTLCAELARQLCIAPQACCLPDGRCKDLPEAVCELGGGTPQGAGSVCRGDSNGNSIDDACERCPGIVSSRPANCAIDARQPHLPGNPGTLQGWNSAVLTFDPSCDVSGATPGDFTVSCTPAGPGCPTITTVSVAGQTATVTLSSVIPAQRWTCITHTATGNKICLGSLPADANSDRTSAPVDILDIIDNLNGVRVPPLLPHQCDIDRSNVCAPADILSEIDLLNGASGFAVWNGKTLTVCPSAP